MKFKSLIFAIAILALILPATGQAQEPKPNPLALKDCLELEGIPATMTLDPRVIRRVWTEVEDKPAGPFVDLIAKEQIVFGDYAPKGRENLEWYGRPYGWKGIDQTKWWDTGLLEFHDSDGELVARAEIREYPPLHVYLVFITDLIPGPTPHGRPDDYHTPNNPNGGDCSFMVDEWQFWVAMGWEFDS